MKVHLKNIVIILLIPSLFGFTSQQEAKHVSSTLIELANKIIYFEPDSNHHFQASIAKEYDELSKLDKAVKDYKEIAAEKYSEIALAYSSLGLHDLSAYYYDRALQLDPGNWRRKFDVAIEYQNIGLVDRAERYYLESKKSMPEESFVLRTIGTFYQDIDKPEQALEHYMQSYQYAKTDEDKSYSAILIYITGNKLAEGNKFAIEGADAWPGPILKYMIGKIDEADLVKVIQAQKPTLARRYLCEGLFYVGAYYDMKGNKPTAKKYFEAVLGQKVYMFREDYMATAYLKKYLMINTH